MAVHIMKTKTDYDYKFSVEFSEELKTLMKLPQRRYEGTLKSATKTRVVIKLRDDDPKKKPTWPDVRLSLPYIFVHIPEYLYDHI